MVVFWLTQFEVRNTESQCVAILTSIHMVIDKVCASSRFRGKLRIQPYCSIGLPQIGGHSRIIRAEPLENVHDDRADDAPLHLSSRRRPLATAYYLQWLA